MYPITNKCIHKNQIKRVYCILLEIFCITAYNYIEGYITALPSIAFASKLLVHIILLIIGLSMSNI